MSAGRKLYSGDVNASYTVEMLAKDSGVDVNILRGLDEGIDMYIHPLKRKNPVEIVEHLKEKYSIDPKITYHLLLDLTERGLNAYKIYRNREIRSRRMAGNRAGLDGFVFEDFFWTNRMSDSESKIKPECEIRLENLARQIRELAA